MCCDPAYNPTGVSCLSMDLRNTQRHTDIVLAPTIITSPSPAGSLSLWLDSSSASVLQYIPTVRGGWNMDLTLELTDAAPHRLHQLLHQISEYGNADMIHAMHVRYMGSKMGALKLLPVALSRCKSLVSLYLEIYMPLAAGFVFELLQTVAHNLRHLVRFQFLLGATDGAGIDARSVSPCTQFVQSALRNLHLDFQGPLLTDMAVSLLVHVAAERRQRSPNSVTTLRVQGSSVGVHGVHALSLSMSLPGCNFHFYPPMSPDVNNIRLWCSSV